MKIKKLALALITAVIACLLTVGINAVSFTNEVGDIQMLRLGSDYISIDGNINTENEVWSKIPATVIDASNSAPAWSQYSQVVSSQEVRFAYNENALYIAAKIYDDSPVSSSGFDTESSTLEHGYNGDVFIFSIDPLKGILNSNNPSTAAPWYCFTIMDDGSTAIYRSHAGTNNGKVTQSIFATAKKGDNCWTIETAIPWQTITDDIIAATGGEVLCAPSQVSVETAVHNAKIIYIDRYVYRNPDMPDYTGMIYGDVADGKVVTICRSFTPCNSIPGTSYAGTDGNPQQARTCGIYIHAADHICAAGNWEVQSAGTCTTREALVKKCTVCGKVMQNRLGDYCHISGDWVITREPSCIAGEKVRCCTICSSILETQTIAAIGTHKDGVPVLKYTVKTNNTTSKKTLYCALCGEQLDISGSNIDKIFNDTACGAWYSTAVAYVYNNNYMKGTGDDAFRPYGQMTRAMMVCLLANIANADITLQYPALSFKDVVKGSWYEPYVKWAYYNDIAAGYSDTVFDPNGSLTREQLVCMLYRFTGDKYDGGLDVFDSYADAGTISNYARIAMAWALDNKVLSGTSKTTLSPRDIAKRNEVAQMIYNMFA